MVAILFGNSKHEIYWGFYLIHKQVVLHLFCNEKWGGLWMVRYALYQEGRRLISRRIHSVLAEKNVCYIFLPV